MDFDLPKLHSAEYTRWILHYQGIKPYEPASKEVQEFYDKAIGDKLYRAIMKVNLLHWHGLPVSWEDVREAFKEVDMEDIAAGKLSRLESGAPLSGAEGSIPSSSSLGESHEESKGVNNKQLRLPQSTQD